MNEFKGLAQIFDSDYFMRFFKYESDAKKLFGKNNKEAPPTKDTQSFIDKLNQQINF